MRKIEISPRVDLYIADEGFLITNKIKKPKITELNNWDFWDCSWQPYKSDKVVEKIYAFLDGCPERYRTAKWYQKLHFAERCSLAKRCSL